MLESDLPKCQGTELTLQQRPIVLRFGEYFLDVVRELGDRDCGSSVTIGLLEGFDFSKDFGGGFLPGDVFRLIVGVLSRGRYRQVVAWQERRKECLEAIIVFLQDRVLELVVVTAGTTDAHPQEDLTRDIGDVIKNVGPLPAEAAVVFIGAQPKVASRHSELGPVRIKLITGELLGQETVVRFVGVEGPDDIVAVTPGIGAKRILPVTVGLGIANKVKPMPSRRWPYRGEASRRSTRRS